MTEDLYNELVSKKNSLDKDVEIVKEQLDKQFLRLCRMSEDIECMKDQIKLLQIIL